MRPRVLLLTSHPVEGRDGADKEIALGLLAHQPEVDYSWLSRFGATPPMGITGRPLRIVSRRSRAGWLERVQAGAYGLVGERDVDLVHVVATIGPSFRWVSHFGRVLSRRGIPVVHTVPGVSRPGDLVDARPLGVSVAVSTATASMLRHAGFPDVRYIPSGIAVDRWDLPDPRTAGRPSVLYAGHHEPGSGVDEMLAAAARVQSQGRPLRVLLAMRSRGGAANRDARFLLETATRRGLDDVAIFGRVEDMPALLAQASVVVFAPPRLVGGKSDVPLIVLEAMAAGRPVIVSDLPQFAALEGAVVRVPATDSAALSSALRRLLAEPSYAAAIGAAGRARVRDHFTARLMAQRYLGLYRELLGGAPAADLPCQALPLGQSANAAR